MRLWACVFGLAATAATAGGSSPLLQTRLNLSSYNRFERPGVYLARREDGVNQTECLSEWPPENVKVQMYGVGVQVRQVAVDQTERDMIDEAAPAAEAGVPRRVGLVLHTVDHL